MMAPRLFIRMVDTFFDCLNVKSESAAKMKRKEMRAPYKKTNDERLKVSTH